MRRFFVPWTGLSATLAASASASAQSRASVFNPAALTAQQRLSREIYKVLVEIDTGVETGNITTNFTLRVTNMGGHSSVPRDDTAITALSGALAKVGRYKFAIQLNEVTRAFFSQTAVRTTCVATELRGGHTTTALPQLAEANINASQRPASPPSALRPELIQNVARITKELWGEMPIILTRSTGGTDSRVFRALGVPAVGLSGLFADPTVSARAQGRDERMGIKSFYEGQEFLYGLTKALSANVVAQ